MATRRRIRWGFVAVGGLILILLLWLFLHPKPKPAHPQAVSVNVAAAAYQDVPISITTIGAAQAWKSDTIRAQVSGKLLSVDFTEGTNVKAGQLLAQVDPAPFEAALLQAQGALRRDQALLDEANMDLKRYQTLAAQNSIARQQAEDQAALAKQYEGTVLLDQGAVKAAQVNLDWCRITSPIDGRAGVRLVDPGNLVSSTDTTGIVIINQIEPIAVTFDVPQGDFQKLAALTNGFSRPLSTQALSQETGQPLDEGSLDIADNHVDPTTGTVELKARFPNPRDRLWPGQFVNVKLTFQTLSHVVTIPTAAVNQGPNGAYAFVVQPGDTVALRPVKVAWTQGDIAVVSSGVQAGDQVVIDGQMILKGGSHVRIVPSPQGQPSA